MSLTGSPSILRTSQRCLRGDWRVYSTTRPWCVISQAWTWLMHPYWMRPPRLQRRCSSATGERPRAGDIGQSHHRCVGGASPAPLSLSLSLSLTHTHVYEIYYISIIIQVSWDNKKIQNIVPLKSHCCSLFNIMFLRKMFCSSHTQCCSGMFQQLWGSITDWYPPLSASSSVWGFHPVDGRKGYNPKVAS